MEELRLEELALIEKYFDYELSEEELKRFDNLYKQESFKQKVINYEASRNYIEEKFWPHGKSLIKEKKEELNDKLDLQSQKRVFPFWKYGIAAGLAILIGALFWLFNPGMTSPTLATISQSSYDLANNTTNLDPLELNIRSGSAVSKNDLWQAYQAKEWNSIIQLTENTEGNASILLLRGIALYQQANYSAALAAFEKSRASNNGIEDNLLWWLSSTYLQLNQFDNAQLSLQEIIDKNYPSGHRARELLDQVKRLK